MRIISERATTRSLVGDIGHFCLGVQNFDADRVLAALQGRGVKASIRTRGQSREVFLTDPDNISVRLLSGLGDLARIE